MSTTTTPSQPQEQPTPSTRSNPFDDPITTVTDPYSASVTTSTLNVGSNNASLTLSAESVIVLDEGLLEREDEGLLKTCCGVLPRKSKATRSIPFYNILDGSLTSDSLTIQYAQPTSTRAVQVASLTYHIEKPNRQFAESWLFTLLDRAYGRAQRKKRIKVLINPFGGTGGALKQWSREINPIFEAAGCKIDEEQTQYSGHATEIAEKLDTDAYDAVACCSGDGLPYEVFNGLGKRPDAARALEKVAVVQLPCGSGNAMSLSLNGTNSSSLAALAIVKGIRTSLDLISITQGDRRTLSFCSQSVGIVAEVDLGTDNIRWMGGARFTVGFLTRLLGKTVYPCDIAVGVEIEDRAAIRDAYKAFKEQTSAADEPRSKSEGETKGLPPLRYGTVNDELPPGWELKPYDTIGNFYSGNMAYMSADANFFPASLPSDGCMDLVMIDGHISRLKGLKMLLEVEQGGLFEHEDVCYRKVSGYRIVPRHGKKGRDGKVEGYISIDGERVPFEPFQAEVHRGLGTVLSKSGRLFEAKGVA